MVAQWGAWTYMEKCAHDTPIQIVVALELFVHLGGDLTPRSSVRKSRNKVCTDLLCRFPVPNPHIRKERLRAQFLISGLLLVCVLIHSDHIHICSQQV